MVLLERTGLLLWLEEPLPWLQVLSLCLALNHLQYPLMGVIIHTLGSGLGIFFKLDTFSRDFNMMYYLDTLV